jgi:hypothetical protein
MDNLREFVSSTLCSVDRHSLGYPETWEKLLETFGFNDENPHELPPEALLHSGVGLRIYQYPNQFAAYMAWISANAQQFNSYLEIGTRHGGTFVTQVETLKLLNPNFCRAVAVDVIAQPDLLKPYDYLQQNSQSQEFKSWIASTTFDLVFVDGDHSYEGVRNDALLTDRSKVQVFHDISSDACPGVVRYWKEHKNAYNNSHQFQEFIEQYSSVEGTYFGIGVSYRREGHWITIPAN